MPQTSRYNMPFLQAGQAQKEITHNDALVIIDTLMQLAVESRHAGDLGATRGTSWIVPANAADVWAGHDGQIATFDDAGWSFVAPLDGCIAFVRDEAAFISFAGGQWRDAWTVPALTTGAVTIQGVAPAQIVAPVAGAIIDQEARTALGAVITLLRAVGLVAQASA